MRLSVIFVSIAAAGLAALALLEDGAGVGSVVSDSVILGFAVMFTATRTQNILLQSLVGTTYLATTALASVAAFLIDRSIGNPNPKLQLETMTFAGVALGYVVCSGFLRSDRPAA
jgi:hypothetical protein